MIVDGTNRQACVHSNCTDPAENLDWVFKPNTAYYRVDGTYLFTTNSAGIVTGNLASPILETSKDYWTGLDFDWRSSPSYDCSLWSTDTSMGIFGRSTSTNYEWYSYPSSIYCSSSFHLLCVEQ